MNTAANVLQRWSGLRGFFPSDLSERAVACGAVKRFRKFRSGEDLLLGSLLCALPGDTFESAAGALARPNGINVSATAMFLRFVECEAFLQSVFTHLLGHAQLQGAYFAGRRVVIVDATALSGPGADRKDHLLHVLYNVSSGLPEKVELTSDKGAETFLRHEFRAGDLVLADRGYAHPKAIPHVLRAGASVLVRFEFESMRLLDRPGGARITPDLASRRLAGKDRIEFEAYLDGWDGPLRVLGCWGAEGKPVWLLTDLSQQELPLEQARGLYSVRWQIELFFKRLKSLLDLGEIATRHGPSARPWIWAKLILAALAVLSTDERFSPWGCPA